MYIFYGYNLTFMVVGSHEISGGVIFRSLYNPATIDIIMRLCLIRPILLFGLAQRVDRNPKAAPASLGKATRCRLKFLKLVVPPQTAVIF